MADVIQIDGSFGEGGGQIVRTCVSLAAMTGRSIESTRCEDAAPNPDCNPSTWPLCGLPPTLCQARLAADDVGSQFLRFEPQCPVVAGDYHFDIGTAGAAPLVVQTVLVPLAKADGVSNVCVIGGTHVPHSPTVEYLEAVYIPTLQKAGLDIKSGYGSAGFYPRGGGEIHLQIGGSGAIAPLDMRERGALKELRAFIVTSNLPEHVAQRGAETVEQAMKAIGRKVLIERRKKPSPGPGAAVIVAAQCETGQALISRRTPTAHGESCPAPLSRVSALVEIRCRLRRTSGRSTGAADGFFLRVKFLDNSGCHGTPAHSDLGRPAICERRSKG